MTAILRNLIHDEKGQGLAEYGLILALVALAVTAALGLLGGGLNNIFTYVNGKLNDAMAQTTPTS